MDVITDNFKFLIEASNASIASMNAFRSKIPTTVQVRTPASPFLYKAESKVPATEGKKEVPAPGLK